MAEEILRNPGKITQELRRNSSEKFGIYSRIPPKIRLDFFLETITRYSFKNSVFTFENFFRNV